MCRWAWICFIDTISWDSNYRHFSMQVDIFTANILKLFFNFPSLNVNKTLGFNLTWFAHFSLLHCHYNRSMLLKVDKPLLILVWRNCIWKGVLDRDKDACLLYTLCAGCMCVGGMPACWRVCPKSTVCVFFQTPHLISWDRIIHWT